MSLLETLGSETFWPETFWTDTNKDISSNLQAHDAIFVFQFASIPKVINSGKLKISAFTEVYRRTKNYVEIEIKSKFFNSVLNKTQTDFFFKIDEGTSLSKSYKRYLWIGLGVISLILIVFLIFKRKK